MIYSLSDLRGDVPVHLGRPERSVNIALVQRVFFMNKSSFRTAVRIKESVLVNKEKPILTLGSCFAEIIGHKLMESGFDISVNPFGTMFHPYSIFEALDCEAVLEDDFFLTSEGHAHHYRLPKTFFAADETKLKDEWRSRHQALHLQLRKPAILLLTLGTSYLYETKGKWVSNCHQRPASEFKKKLSSLDEMNSAWNKVFPKLPKDLTIILSLSPVRHLKDGLVENSLSKSLLRVFIEDMKASAPDRIHYFPAYEILMDDLRDYRFYERDMLHPSEVASEYIWEVFQASYLDEAARERVKNWEKLKARQGHRPLNPHSEENKKFQAELARDLKSFWE